MAQPVPLQQVAGTPSGVWAPKPVDVGTSTQVAALTNVTQANAAPAAGAEPTKAEYDVLVALANANKAKINQIIAALKA